MVTFHGERLEGQLRPVPHRRQELDDPPDGSAAGRGSRADAGEARADARPLGRRSRPTTAAGRYEIKWDGVRAIGYARGRPAAAGQPQRATTSRRATRSCASSGARWAPTRRCSTARWWRSGPTASRASSACRGACTSPPRTRCGGWRSASRSTYVIFDLLFLDGHSLMALPYEERRERLLELGLNGPHWQTPAHRVGDGAALLEATRSRGWRGSSPSGSTARTCPAAARPAWVKVKNYRRADVVVGGWLPGEGDRVGPARRARRRRPRRRRRAALRRPRRHGLRRARARPPRAAARGARARGLAVRAAASRRSRPASSSPTWWRRSSTPSGRRPGRCASPPTRGCATTSSPASVGRPEE